jgi:hypothetical protein
MWSMAFIELNLMFPQKVVTSESWCCSINEFTALYIVSKTFFCETDKPKQTRIL